MTNPPQQPGPHGEQPGQIPPSGSFPQQQPDPYGQPSGPFPQQPGQFGQFPGQAPAQPGQPGQPGGPLPQIDPTTGQPYGWQQPQQAGYPAVGGYATQSNPYGLPSDAFSPRPKRSALPWVLGIGGIVVIGITVTLVLVLTGGTDLTTPRGTAEAVLAATADGDHEGYNKLLCDPDDAVDATEIGRFEEPKIVGDVTEEGDRATVNFTVKYEGEPRNGRVRMERKADGTWCVDRFSAVR